MFDHEMHMKTEFGTVREGEQAFADFRRRMQIPNSFSFKVKTGRFDKRGSAINMNVFSWGFYQAADWNYYVFVAYRTSDRKTTTQYRWRVNEQGIPEGDPAQYSWSN